MMICSGCGKQIVPGEKFCSGCGAAIVAHAVQVKEPNRTPYIVLAAFLLFIVAIAAIANFTDNSNNNDAAYTRHADGGNTSAVGKIPLPSDFFLRASAARGSEGEIYISGSTNLPDGMKMWVCLGTGRLRLEETVFVQNGKFKSAALYSEIPNPNFRAEMNKWPDAESLKTIKTPFPTGLRQVEFMAYFNGAWQNAEVLALTGNNGRNMHGNLFKLTNPDVSDSGKILDAKLLVTFPPLSAEAQAIAVVKHATLMVPGKGRSATDIESNLALYMTMGVSPNTGWSARALANQQYEVAYDFIDGKLGEQRAIWSVNLPSKQVKYVNTYGKTFSWTPSY